MAMSASVKFILCTIALSITLAGSISHAGTKTSIGEATRSILSAAYDPFASKAETESGENASCISSVVYGLRAIGFKCSYKDFKVYQHEFGQHALLLELGKTRFNKVGLILFNSTHFVSLYEDINDNWVVDKNDTIIHAFFHPVRITTLAEWLENDPIRPIRYLDLSQGIQCPE